MYRHGPRLLRSSLPLRSLRAPPTRRLSTVPPAQRSRSWKNSAARWGLAIGAIYYYNTSNVFAEEAPATMHEPPISAADEALPTLAELSPKARSKTALEPAPATTSAETSSAEPSSNLSSDPSDLESEAASQGAFNEETGEINWDCPCLGGMAHGPCGESFRAAFSCFVFSEEEPKGMDCIEKFKGMQDCFREHPDVYGAELEDDDEEGEFAEGEDGERQGEGEGEARAPRKRETEQSPDAPVSATPVRDQLAQSKNETPNSSDHTDSPESSLNGQGAESTSQKIAEDYVVTAAHDAQSANSKEEIASEKSERKE